MKMTRAAIKRDEYDVTRRVKASGGKWRLDSTTGCLKLICEKEAIMAAQHQYTLEEMAQKLDSIEGRLAALEGRGSSGGAPAVPAQAKRLSHKEFLLTKNVGSEIQRVTALAFYLERQEGISTFNVTDLEGAFRAA
jgi:hypothetical protein